MEKGQQETTVSLIMQNIHIIKRNNAYSTELAKSNGIVWISHKSLMSIPWITHAFSTRIGGVSPSPFGDMNLSFTVGDENDNVVENFKLFGEAVGIPIENMVYAHQVHSANVLCVSGRHKGMGIICERDYSNTDGLITDEPGVCLVTSHADCVPLYFVDTVKRVIALSHAGWKGTVGNICRNTVNAMKERYGTNPVDITACIGTSICGNCYEVGNDVADEFKQLFSAEKADRILQPVQNKDDKYLLDLVEANKIQMIDSGIRYDQICMPDLCTSCNTSWLHSHRRTGGKRGGMCAFLMINEDM